jgi:DNA-binding MarR family transcriptional regulator
VRIEPSGGDDDTSTEATSGATGANSATGATVVALAELGSLMIRLRRRDLSLTAEAVLINLERGGPGRVGDLAALVGVSQPTMTELLGRLDRDRLITRDTHPGDRRAVQVSISATGRQFLADRRRATHEKLIELLGRLPAHEIAALVAALPALRSFLLASAQIPEAQVPEAQVPEP